MSWNWDNAWDSLRFAIKLIGFMCAIGVALVALVALSVYVGDHVPLWLGAVLAFGGILISAFLAGGFTR